VSGTLDARGGVAGGNGGYVETSAHQDLEVFNAPDAGARAAGKPGLWFLDPGNVTIGTLDGPNEISAATVEAGLATQNFTVSTGLQNSSGAADTQSILVTSAIIAPLTASRTLTLEASGSIDVAANITNTSTNGSVLNVGLLANSAATVTVAGLPVPATGTGAVTIEPGVTISTGGGAFTASGISFQSQGTVSTSGTSTVPNAGAITITSTDGVAQAGTLLANGVGDGSGGPITINATFGEAFFSQISSLGSGTGQGGLVSLTTSEGVYGDGPLQISSGGALIVNAGGGVSLEESGNLIPSLTVTSAGGPFDGVNISSGSPVFNVQGVTSSGGVVLTNTTAGGQLRVLGTINGDTQANGSGLTITLQADRIYVGPNGRLIADATNGFSTPDYVLILPETADLPVVLTGQTYAGLPANAFAGSMVLAQDFFAQTSTTELFIGYPGGGFYTPFSSISLKSIAGSGGINVPAGTLLSLTSPAITQDGSTRLAVDSLNVDATSASLLAANTSSNGSNQIILTGTALSSGGSLSVGAAAGQTLVITNNALGSDVQGYGTLVLDAPLTLVKTDISGPATGDLNISSNGSLTVGTPTGNGSSISATGDLTISVAKNLSLVGGSSDSAAATIDPGNVTISAGALTLTGG
jgi:hypothetical protein